jgi:hypothetical protein
MLPVSNKVVVVKFGLFALARCQARGWKIQAHSGSPKNNIWIESKFCCKGTRAPEIMGG